MARGVRRLKEKTVEEARALEGRATMLPRTDRGKRASLPPPVAATATIRVLLVDSRPLVLGALAELIDGRRPEMEAIGTASSYARAVYLAERDQPDVILLSVFQDTLDALGTVAAMLRVCNARVLVLKGMHDPVPVARLLRVGAAGFVSAEEPAESIANAVVQVHDTRDEPVPAAAHWAIPVAPAARSLRTLSEGVSRLTRRERELIRAIVDNPGAKYLVIGGQLGISEHTVHNHLSSIYHKLNLVNRTDLLFYAVWHGLVDQPPRAWPGMN
jgi:two-component system, NarL family, response regulator LiaR